MSRRPVRETELARRRRFNRIEAGLDRVTMAERAILVQCATLALQAEKMQEAIVRTGEAADPDELIRLTSEARLMLTGLRKRAVKPHIPLLRDQLAARG